MKTEALVLAPGLLCDATAWGLPLRLLSARLSVQVVNYGELDSLPAMATQLLQQAPPRFALAGHSMGGRVALEAWRQAPERITHLGLFDTGSKPLPSGEAGDKERAERQRFIDIAHSQGLEAMGREWIKGMVHPDRLTDSALIDEIVAMFKRKSVAIFEAQIRALLARPDAVSVLPTIRVPTLVLGGSHDTNSPPAANQDMAAQISGAQLRIIDHCGHMSMQEQPQAVSEAMQAWLM